MTDSRGGEGFSLGDTPDSIRYRKLLEGEGLTSVRLSQGMSAGKAAVGKTLGKYRDKRRQSREQEEIQRRIESGEITDLR